MQESKGKKINRSGVEFEKKTNITKNFFDNLRQNKNKFEELLKTATFSDSDLTANSNEFKIISLLNSDIFSSKSNLSDKDNDDLLRLRRLFNDGRITPFLIKKIINKFKEAETQNDPVRILYLIKDLISDKLIKSAYSEDLDTIYKKKEIILSLNLNG